MTSELRSKLQEDILTAAPWDALSKHVQNIIIVDGISIVDAGEALASDDVGRVEAWLADGTLSRPTADDLERWGDEEPEFVALIVQPWILVSED